MAQLTHVASNNQFFFTIFTVAFKILETGSSLLFFLKIKAKYQIIVISTCTQNITAILTVGEVWIIALLYVDDSERGIKVYREIK